MRDMTKAAGSHSKWEAASQRGDVIKVKTEMARKSKRKRKARAGEDEEQELSLSEGRQAEKKRQRMHLRMECLNSASLLPNPVENHIFRGAAEHLNQATAAENDDE